MTELKLIALDADDLTIVSAHLQDAVLKVADMAYLPKEQRFAALLNRFDWSTADESGSDAHGKASKRARDEGLVRRQAALRFERVKRARVQGLDLAAKDRVLSLLAVSFEAAGPETPEGSITLCFAGDGAVRLEVECIETVLEDLGPAWRARGRPVHGDDGEGRKAGEAAAAQPDDGRSKAVAS